MQYLLIDYGASYIKCIVYDSDTDSLTNYKSFQSPLHMEYSVAKRYVIGSLLHVLAQYTRIKNVVICSILGGSYSENDIYYSWKALYQNPNYKGCLISELFRGQETYHIHKHHSKDSIVDGLEVLGYINGVKFYSVLGDTNCVIESVDLEETDLLINMGTGSQVISTDNITSYIPSGRALNMFSSFFQSMGVDFFERCSKLTVNDLITSTLEIDLNVFEQAVEYNGGGFIKNIHEDNFTVDNMIASVVKGYVTQYIRRIDTDIFEHIFLTGGISKKLPVIKEYITHVTGIETITLNDEYESTHLGMKKLINKYLKGK